MTRLSTPLYRALMALLEQRRQERGLSMSKVDDLAGTQDGYYAKMIVPDAPSGRQAGWPIVEDVIVALFGKDFQIKIEGQSIAALPTGSMASNLNEKARFLRHWRHSRYYKNLSEKGNVARSLKLSAAKRRIIARKAVKARWRKWRKLKRAAKRVPKKPPGGRPLRARPRVPSANRSPESSGSRAAATRLQSPPLPMGSPSPA